MCDFGNKLLSDWLVNFKILYQRMNIVLYGEKDIANPDFSAMKSRGWTLFSRDEFKLEFSGLSEPEL